MALLTFDDLVTGQYLVMVEHDLPGVGRVQLRQLSSAQAMAIAKESDALEGDELQTFIAQKAAEFVNDGPVSDDKLQAFRESVTIKTISKIYNLAMQSSPPDMDLEEAEKN